MAREVQKALSQTMTAGSVPVSVEPLSMFGWYMPVGSFAVADHVLLSLDDGGLTNIFVVRVAGGTGKIQALSGNASGTSLTAGSVTGSVWAHCGATFASTSDRTAYLNGTAATTDTSTRSNSGSPNTTRFCLLPGTTQYADGVFAEWGVWNAVLTAPEITALAAGVSPLLIRPQSLVAYWPLMGKYSPEIDVRGGRDLTLNNGSAVAVHPRVIYPNVPTWSAAPARVAALLASSSSFGFSSTAALHATPYVSASSSFGFSSSATLAAASRLGATSAFGFASAGNLVSPFDVTYLINGVNQSANVQFDSASILRQLNASPNQVSFRTLNGYEPSEGQQLTITLGASTVLFAGEITNVSQSYEDTEDVIRWHVTALDTWLLNKYYPIGRFTWDPLESTCRHASLSIL